MHLKRCVFGFIGSYFTKSNWVMITTNDVWVFLSKVPDDALAFYCSCENRVQEVCSNTEMSSLSTNLPPLLAARVLELHPDPVQRPLDVLERSMAREYKTLPCILEMEKRHTLFWLQKASEQAYRVSEERNIALKLPPIGEMGMAFDFGSVERPKLPPIGYINAHNMAVDLAERNMGADFGYPNLLSTEALKERAKAAKFGFVSYENLPSSSFQAGSSLIESLRGSSSPPDHMTADRKCKLDDTAAKKERGKAYQKAYQAQYKCEHGLHKVRCSSCGGSQLCEHNRRKSQCRDCGGPAFCVCGKRKARCRGDHPVDGAAK